MASLALGAIVISGSNKLSNEADSLTNTYTMRLDSVNQLVDETPNNAEPGEKYGKVLTDNGAEVHMRYSENCTIDSDDYFLIMNGSDVFYNEGAVYGLQSVEYKIDQRVTLIYGFSPEDAAYSYDIGQDGTVQSGTFYFNDSEGAPSHFRFVPHTETHIVYLKFYYSCIASPNPHRIDGEWTYVDNSDLSDGSISITGYSINEADIPYDKTLAVPRVLDGKIVTRIVSGALSSAYWVETLVLPFMGTHKYINIINEHYSFGSIWGSDNERVLDSRYRIINQKEADSGGFVSWVVPANLKNIYINKGNGLDEHDTEYRIPDYAFYGADFLKYININEHMRDIGRYAFANCINIEELVLPNLIKNIGTGAFANMQSAIIRSLGSTAITDSMNPYHCPVSTEYVETIVKDGVKYDVCGVANAHYLNAIGLDDHKTSYIDLDLNYSYKGETIKVHSVANRAFQQEGSIRTVEFPTTIYYVGYNCFRDAYRATIFLSSSPDENFMADWNTGVGGCFTNFFISGSWNDISSAELSNSDQVFLDVSNKESHSVLDLTNIINYNQHPNATLYTAAYCCEGDEYLQTVYLPKKVKLGKYSFYNCPNLTVVNYDGTYSEFIDNVDMNAFKGTGVTEVNCQGGPHSFNP